MRTTDRARVVALALLAALSGSASVGIAALARAGFCLHRIGLFGLQAPRADALTMPGMSGMASSASEACPILIGVSIFGAACYLVAVIALVVLRPSLREFALTSAGLVAKMRPISLAGAVGLIGAVPIGACVVADGATAPAGVSMAALFLTAAALVLAVVLNAAARVVLAFARRVVVAFFRALRLLIEELAGILLPRPPELVPVRIRASARRPSRAPPVRRRP